MDGLCQVDVCDPTILLQKVQDGTIHTIYSSVCMFHASNGTSTQLCCVNYYECAHLHNPVAPAFT